MPDPSPSTLTVHPQAVTCQHCDTHYFSRLRIHNVPIVGPTRATSSATDSYLRLIANVVRFDAINLTWH